MSQHPEPSDSQSLPPPPESHWFRAVIDALRGKQYDYTKGSLNRSILLLAVPMVLEMMLESVFAVVDIYFVGKLGDTAVAAVGLTESMLTIVYALGLGLAMGTTATVARRIGEKNRDAAGLTATQAIAVSLAFGALLGIPALLFAGDLLALMGGDGDVIDQGSGYARILLGSNVVIILLFVNNAVFRGAGDATIAMRSLWIANAINIVLDPCLIFGWGPFPALGLEGAAVATLTGRSIGVLYQLSAMYRGVGRVRVYRQTLRLEPPRMLRLVRVSAGAILQFFIATSSWVALMRWTAPFGKEAVAGYTIGVRIIIFTILPAWGLSSAAATLVGQNLGAKNPERAERCVWVAGFYNMAFLLVVSAVFIGLAPPIVGMFSDDPQVIDYAVQALRIISFGYPAYAWGMVLVQAFNGAGDTKTPNWINLFCYWLLQIPLAGLLAHSMGFGPKGVFWSVTVAEVLYAVVAIWLFRRGKWKDTQV